jgi:hypothetical protein
VDPRRVDCLGFFFMPSDALIYFSHKNVADYYPSATKSQGSHACQFALSCDAVVLFEGVPNLVLTLTILCGGQSSCDLVRSWYRVERRPHCSFGVKIHQLANLEFVFGHGRNRASSWPVRLR